MKSKPKNTIRESAREIGTKLRKQGWRESSKAKNPKRGRKQPDPEEGEP